MQIQEDVLAEYLSECWEKLDKLNLQLGKLEKEGFDPNILRSVARDLHTIKGSSLLFGFNQIGQVNHAMEECLERLSDSSKEFLPELIDCLYKGLDVASKLFKVVDTTRQEPPATDDVKNIIAKLEALSQRAASSKPQPVAQFGFFNDDVKPVENTEKVAPIAAVPPPVTQESAKVAPPPAVTKSSSEDGQADTIRVHVDLLDNLMNLVGELVLIRNQLGQVAKTFDDENLSRVSQRLNVVTGELQNDVMKTRMQPIGTVLNKFQRVVRDMAKDLGKRVDLELSGTETELDKTLIEAIRDPLTHIVRNSIDHGIELPDERKRNGKRENGTLAIRSFHESGQVIIEIRDDGRGLNRDRIAGKAVEKGLVPADSIARLSDREIFQFIFLPGFSTAEKVSNLSGRGVGMDVVRTNIEKIGGTVDLASVTGNGTTLTLKIPLTLAIIPALIVQVAGERFAIPQGKLVELLRIEGDGTRGRGVEVLQGRPVYRLRGHLLPLVDLAEVLRLKRGESENSVHNREINIAVLSIDRHIFGLIIDSIDDSADIVVKPLASFLKELSAYSGATILGDGTVALTLDASGIAALANLAADASIDKRGAIDAANAVGNVRSHTDENTEYLLVDVDERGKYALPLCLVSRLEEFRASDIKLSGDQRVVKYRNSLLPLISVRAALGFDQREGQAGNLSENLGTVSVVVVKRSDRYYGLVVKSIVDVILSPAKIDMTIKDRDGILGSLIEGEDVIAMIDALGLIDLEISRLANIGRIGKEKENTGDYRSSRQKHRILLAEDGAFFRRHITQILQDAGYHVRAECDGSKALAALDSEPVGTYSMILSDIEMPVMTGFDFVQKVRSHSVSSKLPMIALSSRFSDEDIKQGLSLGFNRYIEKLNPEQLLNEVDIALGIRGRDHYES